MSSPDSPEYAMDRLTRAVWILITLVTVNIAISLFALVSRPGGLSFPMVSWSSSFAPPMTPPSSVSWSSPRMELEEQLNGFHDWPLEKQIDKASVVAISKYEKSGDRYKAVIVEILKKDPRTTFHYKVGDEYTHGGFYPRENTHRGEGQLIFFTGNPAMMRSAYSFSGDRIAGLGDIPLEELRKMTKKE